MRVRVLDGDRSCLKGLPVTDLGPMLPEGRARTVVIEEAGQVVGTMTVALVPHIESVWIDPEHRNAGVTRALIRATWEVAREGGATWAFGCADDEDKARRLSRLGGTPLQHTFFMLPMSGG